MMFTSKEYQDQEWTGSEFTSGDQQMWYIPTIDQTQAEVPIVADPDPEALEMVSQVQDMITPTPVLDQVATEPSEKSTEELVVLKEILDTLRNVDSSEDEITTQVTEEVTTEESTFESTEITTSVFAVMDGRLENLEKVMEIQTRDQQLIGRLTVGCSAVLIGGLIIFMFLGRLR